MVRAYNLPDQHPLRLAVIARIAQPQVDEADEFQKLRKDVIQFDAASMQSDILSTTLSCLDEDPVGPDPDPETALMAFILIDKDDPQTIVKNQSIVKQYLLPAVSRLDTVP